MRVLLTMQHPADVHFFRPTIKNLQTDGHDIRVLVREKDVLLTLLDRYGIDHTVLAGPSQGLMDLVQIQVRYELGIFRETRTFDPDVLGAVSEPGIAHVGRLTGTPSVIFSDTEHATVQNKLAYPFANRVVTPACYQKNVGSHQVTYQGYHELAYLHPNRFQPTEDLTINQGDDPLVVIRLGSWDAAHDFGEAGITDPVTLVSELEAAGATVRISTEASPPSALTSYSLETPVDRIHDVLANAALFIGEGATMAAESAILGTPAIYVSTLRLGYLEQLASEYGLVSLYDGSTRQQRASEQARTLLEKDPAMFQRKRSRLLEESVDTTAVIREQLLSAGAPG